MNGEYTGNDPIGQLVDDFKQKDPAKMHSKVLAEASNYYKNTEEGVAQMCRIMEDVKAEGFLEYPAALARLHPLLQAANRTDEFLSAATDADKLKEPCDEFGIHIEWTGRDFLFEPDKKCGRVAK